MRLGVAFGWHVHPWETLLALVRHAEARGFAAAFVDGDISMLASTRRADVLHGWTVTTALLAHTESIQIGSIRLVHHWNTAQLAQAVASLERIHPGRLRFLISIGDRPNDDRFGLTTPSQRDRVDWLDEMLGALRALWRGEAVTLAGRYVQLDGATVQPAPSQGTQPAMPIGVAGRGPKLLELVSAHADIWDINLPPLPDRVGPVLESLGSACRARGRDPAQIARSMWVFTRVGEPDRTAALAEFRRLNPWFHWIPDRELRESLVIGPARTCWDRLQAITAEFELELPTVDLSGLDAAASFAILDALAPEKHR